MAEPPGSPQGALDLLILKTLAGGANHGFGIAQSIEETSSGLLRVEEGSLYPALHRLEKRKLLAASWKQTGSGRRARMYALTAAGRKQLDALEQQWTRNAKGIRKVLGYAS